MNGLLSRLTLVLAFVFAATTARADLLYRIDINSESLAGSSGYLELSLGGLADAPLATVLIHSSTGEQLGAVAEQFGAVSGDLLSTLTMASDMGFADLLQHIEFGDLLSLQLRLTGAWLDAVGDSGLTFAVKLWSSDFLPLLSHDAFGDLLRLELVPGGSVQAETFSEFVTITPLTSVPAPTGLLVMLLGLLLLGRQRRSGVAHQQ